jgi:DNA-directed RNA polymerase specialized sigma24 family protein
MSKMQTGGSKKNWSFDPASVDNIAPIRDALVHHDQYFAEETDNYNTLAIVMEKIVQDLPEELREPVHLVHLEGKTFRAAAKILGIDHKTVKARVDRGVALLKSRLVDSVWIAEMLRGYIPQDEIAHERSAQGGKVVNILNTLKRNDEQE